MKKRIKQFNDKASWLKNGVVYHREGINGDYDSFDDVEELISFIKTGAYK